MKKNLKACNERSHFLLRAQQRLGINIESYYSKIIHSIQNQNETGITTTYVGRISLTKSFYKVALLDKTFVVEYDRLRKQMVTLLLLEMFERDMQRQSQRDLQGVYSV